MMVVRLLSTGVLHLRGFEALGTGGDLANGTFARRRYRLGCAFTRGYVFGGEPGDGTEIVPVWWFADQGEEPPVLAHEAWKRVRVGDRLCLKCAQQVARELGHLAELMRRTS